MRTTRLELQVYCDITRTWSGQLAEVGEATSTLRDARAQLRAAKARVPNCRYRIVRIVTTSEVVR